MKRNNLMKAMKVIRIVVLGALLLSLALTPAPPASAEPTDTTLSVSRVTSRGALGGFGVVDSSGCVQTAVGVIVNESLERVLPSPSLSGKGLTVVLERVDVCAGAQLVFAVGSILDPVITVAKDLRSASVSAQTVVVADRVSVQDMSVGPIDLTWTAEGQVTAQSGGSRQQIGNLLIVTNGTLKFRNGQAQGSVFFEGVNLAAGGSFVADVNDVKDATIEVQVQAP